MKRRRPFELTLRVLGAILDGLLIELPIAAGRAANKGWRRLPWSSRARRARRHRRQKALNAIFAKYAALYGNHTPAFRAAVTDELLRVGYQPPERWRT